MDRVPAGLPRTPARVVGEAPSGALAESAYAGMAIHTLCLLVAGVGVMLLAVTFVQEFFEESVTRLMRSRLILASCLAGGGFAARWVASRGHLRAAAAIVLCAALAAMGLHAWYSGLGTYSIALAAGALLVALAGILVDRPGAIVLGVAYLAMVAWLAWAESSGLLPGVGALPETGAGTRTASFVLLTAVGLVAGWIARRQVEGSVVRAHEQERRTARLLQLGSDFTWEMDAKGRFVYLSPSFETHTGRTIAEFIDVGTPEGPAVVPDDEWTKLLEDLRARRPYRNRVVHFQCRDGTELWLMGSGEPVIEPGGRCRGWWGVSRNATAEMRARRELERSQTMLDRLVRLSPDAICVASLRDGRVLLANPAFLQLTSCTDEEVIGRNGFELGLWRDRESMLALGRAIRAQGWVKDFRSYAWTRDGEAHSVLITAAAFDWNAEEVAVITTRDVSDTERAKQEGDAILDNALVGVCLVRNNRLARVNPQLERMLGLPVGSLPGKSIDVLFPDQRLLGEFAELVEEKQAAGETIDVERRVTRGDGTRILLRMRGRAVDPRRRREAGSIWVVEDITVRRRAELELADAKREAEAASNAKSRFLATMSHEIRTPLSGVLGLARMLQDPELAADTRRDYLAHLVDGAEQLSGIVSDVLDLSKIEAGQLQVEHIAFDLRDLVVGTFRSFAPLGRERGLQMRCDLDDAAPRLVMGDPVRVRQILSNYLSNALKFTDRGEVEVTLLAGLRDPRGARIAVRDTGIGVPDSLRDILFQPFTQADSSTTRRFGGSGLGLSICRELATLMGGDVGLDSDGLTGSVFWVELPLHAIDDDPDTAPAPLSSPQPHPLAGMRVLLAEDNPVIRLIVCATLARLGADVLEAHDGAAAVRVASGATPPLDAVLMDLHMPEVDGLEATRRLRSQPATAGLPIIALSAAVLDAERAQAHAAGMNGFVAKPATETDLLRALWPYAPGQKFTPA